MMKRLALGLTLFVLGYALAWWQFRPAVEAVTTEDIVLARVGEAVITKRQFDLELERRQQSRSSAYQTFEQQKQLLEMLGERLVLKAAALKSGYGDDPDVRNACDRGLVNKFMQDDLESKLDNVNIDEAYLKQYYEENRAKYDIPARYRPAIILLAAPGDASEDWSALEAQANSILEEAQSLPESVNHWGELARKYSQHRASRYQGGSLGWVIGNNPQHSALPETVQKAVQALENPGDFAPIIKTPRGIYLIRLQNFEPARPRAFEKVRSGIQYHLKREKEQTLKQKMLDDLLGEDTLEIYTEFLDVQADPSSQGSDSQQPPAMPVSGGQP